MNLPYFALSTAVASVGKNGITTFLQNLCFFVVSNIRKVTCQKCNRETLFNCGIPQHVAFIKQNNNETMSSPIEFVVKGDSIEFSVPSNLSNNGMQYLPYDHWRPYRITCYTQHSPIQTTTYLTH